MAKSNNTIHSPMILYNCIQLFSTILLAHAKIEMRAVIEIWNPRKEVEEIFQRR